MSIVVRGVVKTFGAFRALDNVTMDVPSGCLLALLGPSGSGKTTLLRILGGLETPDAGTVFFHDEDITGQSARDRNAGFVFQHYALFRHMTVFENIAFGLRVRKRPKDQIKAKVGELLHLVGLEGLDGRMPSQLSGGQRQRVALARALAIEPRILLLDEPFGALDAKVRAELRRWLRRLHDELHVTSLFVTHDQEEAFEVADRVVLMNHGKIEQVGSPDELFEHPASPFVMDFLGNVNVFHGRVHNGVAHFGSMSVALDGSGPINASNIKGYARPHELEIERAPTSGSSIAARVQHVVSNGRVAKIELFSEELGLPLQMETTRDQLQGLAISQGDLVYVRPKQVRVFVPEDYSI